MRGLVERFDGGLGVLDGVGLRKAFCEREVRAAIAGGASQVLVLGAGYDTLCWRLAPELPEVRFFEVDHPATAAAKTRAVDAMGRPSNMAMIAADLGAQPLTEVLDAEGSWRADTRSVVIAEGLLYYLPAGAVLDLLHRVAECTASGSHVAFTFMEPGTLARSRWDVVGRGHVEADARAVALVHRTRRLARFPRRDALAPRAACRGAGRRRSGPVRRRAASVNDQQWVSGRLVLAIMELIAGVRLARGRRFSEQWTTTANAVSGRLRCTA